MTITGMCHEFIEKPTTFFTMMGAVFTLNQVSRVNDVAKWYFYV